VKERFLRFNRAVARLLLLVLTPLLLTLLWIGVGLACLLPRLFAVDLLPRVRHSAETHWREISPPDTSERGLKRQG
jgi:hypothetical protein